MPSNTTQVSSWDQSVVAKYESDYLIWAEQMEVWGKYVNWKEPIATDGGGGSSFDWPVYHQLEPTTTALTETADVDSVVMGDSNITVTPYEYGNATILTKKLRLQNRADSREAQARLMAENQTRTIDLLIRAYAVGGSYVQFPTVATRAALTTTDYPTYRFIAELVARARAQNIPSWEGDTYISVINPLLLPELQEMAEFKSPSYYQGSLTQNLMRGEIGMVAGLRFIVSPRGKMYLAGGVTAQAATTLCADAAVGATKLEITSSTGIAVGDYLLIGTKEAATAEVVRVTTATADGTSVDCTVQGIGNTFTNAGLAYSQANTAAVTEATNAGAIPVLGRESLWGMFAKETGRYGKLIFSAGPDSSDRLGRFLNAGWYWYGGINYLDKYLVRGEVAVRAKTIGKVIDF